MVGALERVMVCSPRTAGWNRLEHAANWEALGFRHVPDFAQAQAQHEALWRELKSAGAEILEIPSAPDLSLDAVYGYTEAVVRYTPGTKSTRRMALPVARARS